MKYVICIFGASIASGTAVQAETITFSSDRPNNTGRLSSFVSTRHKMRTVGFIKRNMGRTWNTSTTCQRLACPECHLRQVMGLSTGHFFTFHSIWTGNMTSFASVGTRRSKQLALKAKAGALRSDGVTGSF